MPGGGLAARLRVNYNYRGLHFFLMQWLPLGRLQGMGARLGDAAMHAPSPPLPMVSATTWTPTLGGVRRRG